MKNLVGKTVQCGDETAVVEKTSIKDVTLRKPDKSIKKVSLINFKKNWVVLDEQPEDQETDVEETVDEVEEEASEEESEEDLMGEDEEEAEQEEKKPAKAAPKAKAEKAPNEAKPRKSKPKKETPAEFLALGDKVVELAEEMGFSINKTGSYTGIKSNRNIAELRIGRTGPYLVVNEKSLDSKLTKLCNKFPENYKWVLNMQYVVPKDLGATREILQAGADYIEKTYAEKEAKVKLKKKSEEKAEEKKPAASKK